MPLSAISDILDDLRNGKFIILVDDEDRENEGDLVLPAQFVTPEAITFMLSVARGYLCLSLTEADCIRLDLQPQAPRNTSARGTAFTISIDGHPKHGFTTGVSAKERARSVLMAIDPASGPEDFVRPGHINPLRARDGGTLVRVGQTEGSIDLCRLAGLYPAALIIEIMRDDGEMARLPDLVELARKHAIRIASVRQIVEHRLSRESLVRRVGPAEGTPLRTPFGRFNAIAFQSVVDVLPHVALCVGGVGDLDGAGVVRTIQQPTLVRMHRRHLLGDVFMDLDSSSDGPSGAMLHGAMRAVQAAGSGAIVYLRPDGLPDAPPSAPPAASGALEQILQPSRAALAIAPSEAPSRSEALLHARMRDFGIGGQILRALGLRRLLLLSNHRREMPALDAFGLEVADFVPLPAG